MDFILELIGELILEGVMEVGTNKKINKWIRYPILALIIFLFGCVIFGIVLLGVITFKQNIFMGIMVISLGLFMMLGIVIKVRKIKKSY